MKSEIRTRIRQTLDYITPDDFDNVALGIFIVLAILNPAIAIMAGAISDEVINMVCDLIVDRVASFDGKVGVFLDDGMVGLSSQMANGFDGYNSYVKIIERAKEKGKPFGPAEFFLRLLYSTQETTTTSASSPRRLPSLTARV